jgi:hypothetical protein
VVNHTGGFWPAAARYILSCAVFALTERKNRTGKKMIFYSAEG